MEWLTTDNGRKESAKNSIRGGMNEGCVEFLPLNINSQLPQVENCTWRYDEKNNITSVQCQTRIRGPLTILTYSAGQNLQRSSLIFSVESWTAKPNVQLMVVLEQLDSFTLRVTRSDEPTWLVLSIPFFSKIYYVLQKFRWDRGNGSCEYAFVIGPPLLDLHKSDRKLWTFSDRVPFVGQYLLASVYSIHVPPGCTPAIAVVPHKIYAWMDSQTQELCSGTVVITTAQYKSSFDYLNWNEPLAELSAEIYCERYPIDVSVEVVELLSGRLSLDFFDQMNGLLGNISLTADKAPPMPWNHMVPRAQLLTIFWSQEGDFEQEDGCFLRVTATRSKSSYVDGVTVPSLQKGRDIYHLLQSFLVILATELCLSL
ncbi:unnamed protein product, partial [Mesorhabditis belari]|uniref:Uncharacterized protein n=1 Tax=Mesorhabditis belari TaxID=2138241 RepID=A0AAF3EXD4_9BILA